MSVEALAALILRGQTSDEVQALIEQLPEDLAADIAPGIGASSPGRRLLAVLRAAIELCHGEDARVGLGLSTDVMAVIGAHAPELVGLEPALVAAPCGACASSISSTRRAPCWARRRTPREF